MGKKSRAKPRRNKPARATPGEVLAHGPLRVERYGRHVRMVNLSTPEQHVEFLKRAADYDRQVRQDLERKVPQLQERVARFDAVDILHRAAYTLLPLFLKYRSQHEFETDESYFLPAVEYLQYLIARIEPNGAPEGLSEPEWDGLWAQTLEVLHLTQQHLMYRKTLTTPPSEIDELRFILDGRRLLIRVNRYPVHHADHLRSSLEPYDQQLQEVHGIGATEAIAGIGLISEYQKSGVLNRYRKAREVNEDLMARLEAKGYSVRPGANKEEVERTRAALESPEFKELHDQAQEHLRLAFTPAIFDITDLTALPKPFLSFLSVRPGEAVLRTLTGPAPEYEDLSPLSDSILHKRPFLEVDGRFYTFYHSGFEDHIAPLVEADLFEKRPQQVSVMAKRRSDRLEAETNALLESVLLPDLSRSKVFYPNPDDPGNIAELDILMRVDDVLFLVEAKAGGFSAAAVRGAPKSVAQELSDLIIEGQRQSERAERYIKSVDEARFFDETGKQEVCRVRRAECRRIVRIVVTREDLGWVGARIAMLSILDPSLSKSYPWHISIDDLRVVAELFANDGVRFAHYLELRLLASAEVTLVQHDEVEHVGLYNKLNFYHESQFQGAHRQAYDASFMLDIDEYFMALGAGEPHPLPTQEMPPPLRQLIAGLTQSRVPHRVEAGSVLLSLDGEHRNQLGDALQALSDNLAVGKRRTIRWPMADKTGLTVTYAEGANWKMECLMSVVQMEVSQCTRWLVIQLAQVQEGRVLRVERLLPGAFTEEELEEARLQRQARTQEIINMTKVGRNDPCPCDSGKKFKKCHGK